MGLHKDALFLRKETLVALREHVQYVVECQGYPIGVYVSHGCCHGLRSFSKLVSSGQCFPKYAALGVSAEGQAREFDDAAGTLQQR